MNFYNPFANLPADFKPASGSEYHESIAALHLGQATEALQRISEQDPVLAKHISQVVIHFILAANAYNHDMFQRSAPQDEDIETKIRKNR